MRTTQATATQQAPVSLRVIWSHSPAAEQAVVCKPHTGNRTHRPNLDGQRGAVQTHIRTLSHILQLSKRYRARGRGHAGQGQGRTTHHSRVTRGVAQTSRSGDTRTAHLRARYQQRYRWPASCLGYGSPRWSQTHRLQPQPLLMAVCPYTGHSTSLVSVSSSTTGGYIYIYISITGNKNSFLHRSQSPLGLRLTYSIDVLAVGFVIAQS